MENALLIATPKIQRQDNNFDFQPLLTAWRKHNHFKNENERLNQEEEDKSLANGWVEESGDDMN